MKKIFVCLAGFALFSGIACGQEVQYRFSQDSPLNYSFKIEGDIFYQYEGIPGQEFRVLSKGNITLETLENKGDFYKVKLTPSRTFVELNNMVLEDITTQETARSEIISTAVMDIMKNGKIVSTKEISPGILNLSQMLMMMPAFPDNLRSARRWEQTVPAFSLPGVPMCDLKFTYLYTKGAGDAAKIGLLSNQSIKEKRKDGDVDVNLTGLNSAKGEFLFNESLGEIRSFEGVINLVLTTVFKMPAGPGQETTTKQSLPLKMRIKLNVNLSAINR